MEIYINNYRGRIISWFVPDRDGRLDDIVLGYDNINDYLNSDEVYYGALIGRYGNRNPEGLFYYRG